MLEVKPTLKIRVFYSASGGNGGISAMPLGIQNRFAAVWQSPKQPTTLIWDFDSMQKENVPKNLLPNGGKFHGDLPWYKATKSPPKQIQKKYRPFL